MGDTYKGRLAGHVLVLGGHGVQSRYPDLARCRCGAESSMLKTRKQRVEWHQQHKADVLDTWVANGCDDRGREIHL
jgi:hypothetical protein